MPRCIQGISLTAYTHSMRAELRITMDSYIKPPFFQPYLHYLTRKKTPCQRRSQLFFFVLFPPPVSVFPCRPGRQWRPEVYARDLLACLPALTISRVRFKSLLTNQGVPRRNSTQTGACAYFIGPSPRPGERSVDPSRPPTLLLPA